MQYQYVAYNTNGEVVKGKLSAVSDQGANELLDYAGYKAISLKPYTPFFTIDSLSSLLYQVKSSEVILLYRQLALLLESGTDIAASLELLEQQISNKALKKILNKVVAEVRGGSQLSESLAKHPKIFPDVYCKLISVGEQSGDLETILKQVADYMERELKTAKQTKGALMMPGITAGIAVAVIILMVLFVLPSFSKMYVSLGVELPAIVQLLITAGEKAKENGIVIMVGLLAAAVIIYLYIKTPKGRYNFDKLLLKLPLMGRVRLLSELSRFCRSMALLFNSGLPLPEIILLAAKSSGNKVVIESLMNVHSEMIKGEGISGPMSKDKIFLPMMVQMVKVGEETGSLDKTLLAVANSYEAEGEDKMQSFIGLIQPTMTIAIGGVVGGIAVILMSAMTSMYGGL